MYLGKFSTLFEAFLLLPSFDNHSHPPHHARCLPFPTKLRINFYTWDETAYSIVDPGTNTPAQLDKPPVSVAGMIPAGGSAVKNNRAAWPAIPKVFSLGPMQGTVDDPPRKRSQLRVSFPSRSCHLTITLRPACASRARVTTLVNQIDHAFLFVG